MLFNPKNSKPYNNCSLNLNPWSCSVSSVGLIRRMRNWCSQFSANLAQNYQCSYPPFTLGDRQLLIGEFHHLIPSNQNKIIHMKALRASTNQTLLVGETKNMQERRKQKGKDKRNTEFKPKEYFNPIRSSLLL